MYINKNTEGEANQTRYVPIKPLKRSKVLPSHVVVPRYHGVAIKSVKCFGSIGTRCIYHDIPFQTKFNLQIEV